MTRICTLIVLADLIITTAIQAAWVGESFWTTIYPNGQIEEGRSPDDFLHFKILRENLTIEAFIGFLIKKGEVHHESFGHVFLDRNRVCGQFLAVDGTQTERVCGGFRVLSRDKDDFSSPSKVAQPYDSIGYRRKQIARIWVDDDHSASIFGGISLQQRQAYGIFENGTTIKIDYATNPEDYAKRVEVLHMNRDVIEKIKQKRLLQKELRAFRGKRKNGEKQKLKRKTVKRRRQRSEHFGTSDDNKHIWL
ncbi:hypothetical protein M3Y98_00649200 [Aphelenchoides besseyi]|nr:hypothetical protein M3Y98_00649200 [Aphelenchoides besseyi]KAI6208662.1 hypothetical protein M3Y96_00138700 [Aphelenchoides besseyi]